MAMRTGILATTSIASTKPRHRRAVPTIIRASNVNNWPRVERQARRAKKKTLRFNGIRPAKRQWMVCVEVTAIEVPAWARAMADERMSSSERHVWFKGRRSGKPQLLAKLDREAGGRPDVTAMEWRLCGRCGAMLLSLAAEMRRRMDEIGALGRMQPCGPECGG